MIDERKWFIPAPKRSSGAAKGALSRRQLLAHLGAAPAVLAAVFESEPLGSARDGIIDFHQHVSFGGRSLDELIRHQSALKAERTVLLAAGRHGGLGAGCGAAKECEAASDQWPGRLVWFANDTPNEEGARRNVERQLQAGAVGIGELKYPLSCLSPALRGFYDLAREFKAPVLLHFEFGKFGFDFEKFHKILETYPEVNFIGHAQTWWGSVDDRYNPAFPQFQRRIRGGGYTEKLFDNYQNVHGDLSGRHGLEFLSRDQEFVADFLERRADKLVFGSDCADERGAGAGCHGWGILQRISQLTKPGVTRRILFLNGRKLLRMA